MFYQTIIDINHQLIMGETLNMQTRHDVVQWLIQQRGHKKRGASMVPVLFPSTQTEREQGVHLVTGEYPRTRMLADNALEMEALRLIALWGRGQAEAEQILSDGIDRLQQTCFSSFCPQGECWEASMAFLRLWIAYQPEDWTKQTLLVSALCASRFRRMPWLNGDGISYYTLLALSECQPAIASFALRPSASMLEDLLMQSISDGPFALLHKHILRKALCCIPGYSMFNRIVFVQDKQGTWVPKLPELGVVG